MTSLWIYLAAAAVLAAVGYRVANRLRFRVRFRAALHSPSETVRRAAVRECVAIGVTETARMLVRVVREERSPAVLAELAIALAERQWEPASRAELAELRIWARGYTMDHPDLLAVDHGPKKVGLNIQGADGDGQGEADEDESATMSAPHKEPTGHPAADRRAVPEVAPTTVLVTGAGQAAAIATIRELRRLDHRVVAVDENPLAYGLRLADVGETVPAPGGTSFGVSVLGAARRHGASALICTVAAGQFELGMMADELTAAGVRCALPQPLFVQPCLDKQRLLTLLQDSGLPVPGADTPAFLPEQARYGRTSSVPREFVADALVASDGEICAVVTHWRLETVAGITARAETFADDEITSLVVVALKVTRLTGPVSVRGVRMSQSEVMLLDVDPYYSADLPLSLHAGADLVGQHLRQVFGLPILAERLTARTAVVMMRDFTETFEE